MSYKSDLARIHDDAFGGIARDGAACMLGELRRRGIERGLVADLGCGSGITARALRDAGFAVWGVDLSPVMVAMARERVPDAEFAAGSVYDTTLPSRCVAVSAIGEIFNYGFDERAGAGRLDAIFARVYAALGDGGFFLFDFAEPGRGGEAGRQTWSGEGWEMQSMATEDAAAGTLTRRITTSVREGDSERVSQEVHVLHLYPRDDVLAGLERAGFVPVLLPAYAEHPLPNGFVVVLASV